MRIDIQRKIFKRDITVRCIHTVLVQRQRAGTAAGNGQILAIKSKTCFQRDVLQQVDLIVVIRRIDRVLQRCVGRVADLAHSRFWGAGCIIHSRDCVQLVRVQLIRVQLVRVQLVRIEF